jgi:hypothetical protein
MSLDRESKYKLVCIRDGMAYAVSHIECYNCKLRLGGMTTFIYADMRVQS